jgi:hypothetical protein
MSTPNPALNRRRLLSLAAGAAAAAALASPATAAPALPMVEVHKDPDCGCCAAWVEHLKAAGFPVKVHETANPAAVRGRLGMPDEFGSCHTAVVAGYALEGHVPAAEVKRLLAARPAAIGLSVPGMPAGSPGMEVGVRQDPYEVLLIDKRGKASVFARYPQARA